VISLDFHEGRDINIGNARTKHLIGRPTATGRCRRIGNRDFAADVTDEQHHGMLILEHSHMAVWFGAPDSGYDLVQGQRGYHDEDYGMAQPDRRSARVSCISARLVLSAPQALGDCA
jgi:hypothetical protein